MTQCSACRATIPAKEQVKCSTAACLLTYHFQCVGLSKGTKPEDLAKWKCPQCKLKEKRTADFYESPVRKNIDSGDVTVDSDTSNVTLRPRRPIQKDDDSSEILTSLRTEILAAVTDQLPRIIRGILDQKLAALGTRIQSLEDSVTMVSDKYDETRMNLDTQSSSLKKLQSENKQLKDSVKDLEQRLSTAEDNAAKQEQWAKQQNVEIVGIPEVGSESLRDLVVKVAEYAALPLQQGDIEFAHRVSAKRPVSGKPRAIIVRFRERTTKDSFLSAIRKKQGITSKDIGVDGDLNVYVNEHLTLNNKQLLSKCKNTAKEHNFKYVWTKNCRIYVRRNDTSPYILVSKEADLKKIV